MPVIEVRFISNIKRVKNLKNMFLGKFVNQYWIPLLFESPFQIEMGIFHARPSFAEISGLVLVFQERLSRLN